MTTIEKLNREISKTINNINSNNYNLKKELEKKENLIKTKENILNCVSILINSMITIEELNREIFNTNRIINSYNYNLKKELEKKEKLIKIKQNMCEHEFEYDNTCCFDDKFKYICKKCHKLQSRLSIT